MKQLRLSATLAALCLILPFCAPARAADPPESGVVIVHDAEAGPLTAYAARELRRCVHQCAGELLPVQNSAERRPAIILGVKDSPAVKALRRDTELHHRVMALDTQSFLVKSVERKTRREIYLVGGGDAAVLHAAYRFAELLGMRFYLHGDVAPDEKTPLALPEVEEWRRPLFELRGIQPFHDFPEGPDWWGAAEYRAVIGQLPKMGMNFIGLHTYPLSEPTVWVGGKNQINPDGTVRKSYPTQYFNTAQTSGWGYKAKKTGDFACGAAVMFEDDAYGADFLRDMMPAPDTEDEYNAVFNRTGALFAGAFGFARKLGVKTCMGTETPLRLPPYILSKSAATGGDVSAAGGANANYAGAQIADTEDDALYQSVRYNLDAYRFRVPDGRYTVTLKFCEVAYDTPGARVFDVSIEGRRVIEGLDIFREAGKNKALDKTFENIPVGDGVLDVDFGKVVEFPAVAAVEVAGEGLRLRVNCGGDAYKDWAEDAGVAPDPELVRETYEGVFTRIMRTHPLDYYWFWTPEDWTWSGTSETAVKRTVSDLLAANAALRNTGAPFQLATCGWVLGPQFDRAYLDKMLPKDIAMSCINRQLGFEPVDGGFKKTTGRGKWAIPWLEDDPAMSIPQFWARRMRRDAQTALDYGCTGLMGIHWRTRVIAPTLAALAKAGWDQQWPQAALPAGSWRVRDASAGFPVTTTHTTADISGTDLDAVYQTIRLDAKEYLFDVPNGVYTVTLRFCEPAYGEMGRRVFDVALQGVVAAEALDLAREGGVNAAVDRVFPNVAVGDGRLRVGLVKRVDWPVVSAVEITGNGVDIKVNCGGGAVAGYAADLPMLSEDPSADDFYADWARHEFGPEVADDAARIFARLDGCAPRPATWTTGPGAFFPDSRPWELARDEYAFVDEFAALADRVRGDGARYRYEYWLNALEYLRAAGKMNCAWAVFDRELGAAKARPDAAAKKAAAVDRVLPARRELVAAAAEMCRRLIATANSPGELGNIANIEGHTFPKMLGAPGAELETLLGAPLPEDAQMPRNYGGPPRLFTLAAPGSRDPGAGIAVKAVVLSDAPANGVVLRWRVLGAGEYQAVPAVHVNRGVWRAELPADALAANDIEYHLEAALPGGALLRWPAGAPQQTQAVVLGP